MSTSHRKFIFCGMTFALLALFCAPAVASPLWTGNVVIDIAGMNTETGETLTDEITIPISDGSYGAYGLTSQSAYWDQASIDVWGNADPYTNLVYGLTNNSAVAVEYTFSVTLPITPIAGATFHGGSTGGSVNETNHDGGGFLSTITSVPGVPFYAGQIDGITVLSIYPDPTTFTLTFSGQNLSIPSMNPGLPGPTLPSGPALSTIGIVNRFRLSAGDSMSINNYFEVVPNPVPEPSTLVLALGGVLALGWQVLRRRRG